MQGLQKLFKNSQKLGSLQRIINNQQQCYQFSNQKKYNVLFFGSDDFPYPILKTLHENFSLPDDSEEKLVNKLEVVTHVKKDRQKKIRNKIHKYALDNNLPLQMPMGNMEQNTKETRKIEWKKFYNEYVTQKDFNLGIVCSYGYMVPSYIIKQFSGNMIVIHPSLLPKYRGAAPLQHALFNGDKESGVSFIKISILKFDAGEIVHQTQVPIDPELTYKELSEKLSQNGSDNILYMLKNFDSLERKEQNEEQKTPAPLIQPEDLVFNFQDSSEKIFNQYRALKGSSFSAARANFGDKLIFFEQASLPNEKELQFLEQQAEKTPGYVQKAGQILVLPQKSQKNNIYVLCGDNKYIVMKEWKIASGQPKKGYVFRDQYLDKQAILNGEKVFAFNN